MHIDYQIYHCVVGKVSTYFFLYFSLQGCVLTFPTTQYLFANKADYAEFFLF